MTYRKDFRNTFPNLLVYFLIIIIIVIIIIIIIIIVCFSLFVGKLSNSNVK